MMVILISKTKVLAVPKDSVYRKATGSDKKRKMVKNIKERTMDNTTNMTWCHVRKLAWVFVGIVCLAGVSLQSCVDDDLAKDNNNVTDKGSAVAFSVSDVQNNTDAVITNAAPAGGSTTRAAFVETLALQDLTPKDLTTQQINIEGGGEGASSLCLVETTVPGVSPTVQHDVKTRANIATAITENFSSFGYRGATAAGISDTPWFHNKETKSDGTLVQPVLWSWKERYGRFYGISPQVTTAYPKLTVSSESHAGTPYLDFEVEPDVRKQQDLMTACSGVVEYATRYKAPDIFLHFRHALTAVRFKVGQNLSWNKTITKVEIVGAKSKGRYTLATDKTGTGAGWSSLDAPQTFTLKDVNVSTSQDINKVIMGNTGDNFTFYMLPQQLTGNGVKVKIYFGDTTPAITATLKGQWKPGTTKTYSLSQKTSDWTYTLTTTDPAVAAYTDTEAKTYTITSYRQDKNTNIQQPVSWKVVGYDSNNDGKFSMDEKPSWLTSLSLAESKGNTAAESGTATLKTDIVDLLATRNISLNKAAAKGSASTPYNLSNSTGAGVVQNTANCYVISAAGYYCIPLVYGNAIKGGVSNPGSYQTNLSYPNTDLNTDYDESTILRNFKDHAGNDVTDPWITKSNGGKNIPDGAKVVWADSKGLVTNLKLTGDGTNAFVKFEVPASAITSGNAVIAVTKGETVVWSWHLWFAPQDVLHTIAVTNHKGYVFNFSNETLGFKYTHWIGTVYSVPRSVKVKVAQTFGGSMKKEGIITITQKNGNERSGYSTLYQWGRKDAFPGTDDIPEGSFKKGGDNMSLANGIKHPDTFYAGITGYQMPPKGCIYENLWTMKLPVSDDENYGGGGFHPLKTIYDPCPVGFMVPGSNAFTGLTAGSKYIHIDEARDLGILCGWENGWVFFNKKDNPDATIYFPATGSRKGVVEVKYMDYLGKLLNGLEDFENRYWQCILTGESAWSGVFANDVPWYQGWSHMCDGCAIRPITE